MNRAETRRARRQLEAILAAWPDDAKAFLDIWQTISDPETLLAAASGHSVLGVLARALLKTEAPLSPGQSTAMRQRDLVERALQGLLVQSLDDITQVFASAGIQAVALKGPVLSERLFGDATMRRSVDLDFLVAEVNLDRATDALKALGYEPGTGRSERYFRQYHHHIHLSAPRRPILELHFRLSSMFGMDLHSEGFLERAESFQTARGSNCWVLSPDDEFLYLAQHAAGHYFARLGWLYDLKMLVRRDPGLDWATIGTRARSLGISAAVHLATDQLARRLHVPGEATAGNGFGRLALARPLLSLLQVHPPDRLPGKLLNLGYESLLCDRWTALVPLLRRRLAAFRSLGE